MKTEKEIEQITDLVILYFQSQIDLEIIVDKEFCFDLEDCIVICYNSKSFLESNIEDDMLLGNIPFVINKINGSVFRLKLKKCEYINFDNFVKNDCIHLLGTYQEVLEGKIQ